MTSISGKSLLQKLIGLLLLLLLATALLALLLLQTTPSVPESGFDTSQTRQLEQIIVDNSPSRFGSSGNTVLRFDSDELDLMAGFASRNLPQFRNVTADFTIVDSNARVLVSLPWPGPQWPFFLNLRLRLEQGPDRPRLSSLKLGHVSLPAMLVSRVEMLALNEIEKLVSSSPELDYLHQSVQGVEISTDTLDIHLNWESQQLTRLRDQAQFYFIEPEDRSRILYYYDNIRLIADSAPADSNLIPLQGFINPLFADAARRSDNDGDPIAENRSLLQALSLYVNNLELDLLFNDPPATRESTRMLSVRLHRRADLAQHFVSSSAIAASAGAGIAEILSNSKEVYDARYRTGFSFSDMTANAAGMMLGTLATSSPDSARRVQLLLADSTSESDYMPDVGRDMRGISEQDFTAEFNDRNSPDYLQRLQEIESQIAGLPLYAQGIQ